MVPALARIRIERIRCDSPFVLHCLVYVLTPNCWPRAQQRRACLVDSSVYIAKVQVLSECHVDRELKHVLQVVPNRIGDNKRWEQLVRNVDLYAQRSKAETDVVVRSTCHSRSTPGAPIVAANWRACAWSCLPSCSSSSASASSRACASAMRAITSSNSSCVIRFGSSGVVVSPRVRTESQTASKSHHGWPANIRAR
eukprot:SAG11_NODE_2614_length_3170_cov_2.584500_6_plen_197_part_00